MAEAVASSAKVTLDLLVVDEALSRLAEFDARQARVLELHFFGGLTFEEIAAELGVSSKTIKRDCNMARAWLYGLLSQAHGRRTDRESGY